MSAASSQLDGAETPRESDPAFPLTPPFTPEQPMRRYPTRANRRGWEVPRVTQPPQAVTKGPLRPQCPKCTSPLVLKGMCTSAICASALATQRQPRTTVFRQSPTPVCPPQGPEPPRRRRRLRSQAGSSVACTSPNPASLHSAVAALSRVVSQSRSPHDKDLREACAQVMRLMEQGAFDALEAPTADAAVSFGELRKCPMCHFTLCKKVKLGVLATHINKFHQVREVPLWMHWRLSGYFGASAG